MADQTHLDILLQGVETWNEWREHNPSTKPDLSGADLSGADLTRANLTKAELSTGIYLQSVVTAKLTGADLTEANLTEAELSGADLTGMNLQWTNFSGADLSGVTNVTQHQIEEAFGDEQTKLPEHLKRPADWSRSSKMQPNEDE